MAVTALTLPPAQAQPCPGDAENIAPPLAVPFHRPSLEEADFSALIAALRSGWLTSGPEVAAFESEFAAFVQSPHAVALNSGTAALHLALAVAGIGPGDEVLLPVNTFTATAEVIVHLGATPVFCDILPTLNLDPAEVERKITPHSRALLPVHVAGQPADLAALQDLARRHHLWVIEDAAHALPARFGDRWIGGISDITCFSFYATKTLTTCEGGMLTTPHADWAARARRLARHGIAPAVSPAPAWNYEVLEPGYKYNLADPLAALGRSQLRRQMDLWQKRKSLAAEYIRLLSGCPGIEWPESIPDVQSAWHLLIVLLDLLQNPRRRLEVSLRLRRQGIETSVHFQPLHQHPWYARQYGLRAADFPRATSLCARCLSLPLYPGLSASNLEHVAQALQVACA